MNTITQAQHDTPMINMAEDQKCSLLSHLSPRERELLHLLLQGLRVTQIAARMGIQQQTASLYKQRILWKLDLKNELDLVLLATAAGIINLQKANQHLEILTQLQAA